MSYKITYKNSFLVMLTIIFCMLFSSCASNKEVHICPAFLVEGKLKNESDIEKIIKIKSKEYLENTYMYNSTSLTQKPIFPCCSNSNESHSDLHLDCLGNNVKRIIAQKFNRELFDDAPRGEHKVYCFFTVTKNGKIENIDAYGKYKKDEEEVCSALFKCPDILPGEVNNTPVNVAYIIPITFMVE